MIDFALDNRILIKSELEAFIQEIDILFNTSKTELIGDTSFGSSFSDYLWELNLDIKDLIAYTRQLIQQNTYYSKYFAYDVYGEMVEGEYRYIYLIQISIYKDNEIQAQKTYQFR